MAIAMTGAGAPVALRSAALAAKPVAGRPLVASGPSPAPVGGDRLSLSAPALRDPRNFAPYLQDQRDREGTLNACGTTSAAMLLSYLKGKPGSVTIDQLDARFRAFNGPTSPHNVASALEAHGQQVAVKQGSNLDELGRLVDQGTPALVLIDPDGNGSDQTLHYVLVTGVVRDAQGQVAKVKIANPWGDAAPGPNASRQLETMDAADFDQKWADLKFMGHSAQMDRVLIAAKPQDASVAFRGADGQTRSGDRLWQPKDEGLGVVPKLVDWGLDVGNAADAVVGWGGGVAKKVGGWFGL